MNTTNGSYEPKYGALAIRAQRRLPCMVQKQFRLSLPREKGQPQWQHTAIERDLNAPARGTPYTQDRLAVLLKDQAREVMREVTQCVPAALPVALAHLRDIQNVIHFAIQHRLVNEAERTLSGRNLIHCYTLCDYAAALDVTRQAHREPPFASQERREHEEIITRLDTLAAMLSGVAAAPESEVGQ